VVLVRKPRDIVKTETGLLVALHAAKEAHTYISETGYRLCFLIYGFFGTVRSGEPDKYKRGKI
jgi:hypothetical protein